MVEVESAKIRRFINQGSHVSAPEPSPETNRLEPKEIFISAH